MSLLAFFEQLAESPWSVSIHESEIAYSLIESIHVWSMCLFFGLAVMFDLRLLGWTMLKVPVSEFSIRSEPQDSGRVSTLESLAKWFRDEQPATAAEELLVNECYQGNLMALRYHRAHARALVQQHDRLVRVDGERDRAAARIVGKRGRGE